METLHLVLPSDVMNAGNRDYKTLCGAEGKSTLYLRDVNCPDCRERVGR